MPLDENLSDYSVIINSFCDQLLENAPTRKINRNYQPVSIYPLTDLYAGVFTVVSGGLKVSNTQNHVLTQKHTVSVVGYTAILETETGVELEEKEFQMYHDVVRTIQYRKYPLGVIDIISMQQSQQLEMPYGWIVVTLEFLSHFKGYKHVL